MAYLTKSEALEFNSNKFTVPQAAAIATTCWDDK